jgi:hypothetical protein
VITMTEIKDHKTFWKRSTMEIITYTEGSLADIIQLARKDILSLITTIESQKEEIEKLSMIHNDYKKSALARIDYEVNQKFLVQDENVSLKAITELAVKENENLKAQLKNAEAKEFAYDSLRKRFDLAISALNLFRSPRNKYPEIVQRLSNETLSEIERLSHEHT